jgi:tRNA pseudouridine38-40 synthase
MATFKLMLEYDGTDFEGWQSQPSGHRTVQGTLEAVLARIAGGRVPVAGAGRTDSGVHAEGQVASAALATRLGAHELQRALNAQLPPDLAVVDVEEAPGGFHARYDARAKVYRYEVWNAPSPSPLRARRTWHRPLPLDVAAMAAAAAAFEGTHDFSALRAAGSRAGDPVRTLHRVAVRGSAGGLLWVEVAGTGFLRHMVRNLIGTLVEVGYGRRAVGAMTELLAGRDRGAAGPTAPARGLTLVRVEYGPPAGGFPRRDRELAASALDSPEALG